MPAIRGSRILARRFVSSRVERARGIDRDGDGGQSRHVPHRHPINSKEATVHDNETRVTKVSLRKGGRESFRWPVEADGDQREFDSNSAACRPPRPRPRRRRPRRFNRANHSGEISARVSRV